MQLFDEPERTAPGNPDGAYAAVRFLPVDRRVLVPTGTTLLDAARQAGMPVAQSCGGWAICSWCRMQILEGARSLSPVDLQEERLMVRQGFAANERASCRAAVNGDVTVTTTYW